MSLHIYRFLLAFLCLSATTLYGQTAGPERSLLERLYSLVWPAGRFRGDLVSTIERNTQKGASGVLASSLFLVNSESQTSIEWPGTQGAREPVVCQADRTLVFRLGNRIVVQSLTIANGNVRGGERATFPLPANQSLVACTANGPSSSIWIQTDDTLVPLVRRGTKLEPGTIDQSLTNVPPRQLAAYLRVMGSLRPDGVSAAALNGSLVGQNARGLRKFLADSKELRALGVPCWLGGGPFVFVLGERVHE